MSLSFRYEYDLGSFSERPEPQVIGYTFADLPFIQILYHIKVAGLHLFYAIESNEPQPGPSGIEGKQYVFMVQIEGEINCERFLDIGP